MGNATVMEGVEAGECAASHLMAEEAAAAAVGVSGAGMVADDDDDGFGMVALIASTSVYRNRSQALKSRTLQLR